MIVMVFEYRVEDDFYDEYLKEAMDLRPHLKEIEGFVSIERFESKTEPGKFVSIGYFEDEEAVTAWRNTPQHRRVQALGRKRLLKDYRLCMADVSRDYSMTRRGDAPQDSKMVHGGEEMTDV
ncbi:antibiotic biosynthesis monooxygenase family protein [Kiloniella sp.]|uniref:antibiotic biosynthesis monooxygenase family protein n=1 Tax=Kiloniella sp. TaxID=1938587 RepID=UPI003B01C368